MSSVNVSPRVQHLEVSEHVVWQAARRAWSVDRVATAFADCAQDGQDFSLGGSWQAVVREILISRKATIVLSLVPPPASGPVAAVLRLPFVEFLAVPFARVDFDGAAERLKSAKFNERDVNEAKRCWCALAAEDLRRDVIHVLNGGVVGFVSGLPDRLAVPLGTDSMQGEPEEWRDAVRVLNYYAKRLQQISGLLADRVVDLEGIAAEEVLVQLREALCGLGQAKKTLAELALGLHPRAEGGERVQPARSLAQQVAGFVQTVKMTSGYLISACRQCQVSPAPGSSSGRRVAVPKAKS